MIIVLLVGAGGAIGAVARYLVSTWTQRRTHSGFPWGTVTVNGTGSFMIGAVFAWFDGGMYGDDTLLFLVAGILGGYTTFSTFSVENMNLIEHRRYRWLLQNTVGQAAGCLLLVVFGYWLGSAVR